MDVTQPSQQAEKGDENPIPILPVVWHQSTTVRRGILAAYWTIVLVCLPIWWAQTSIQRLSLPKTRILRQEQAVQEASWTF
jgi:hypothetical protein